MPANPDTHYTNTFTIQGAGTNVVSFAQNANKTLNIAAGTNVTVTPDATNGKITISSADTHYTTGLYVGATGAKSNAATTNGNTYLKLFDNDTSRANLKITGTGATTVASDASGNITISSTNSTYNGNLKINAYLDDTLTATNLVNYTPSSNADLTLNHGNYIKYTKSANSLTVDVNTDSLVTTNSSDHIIMYGGTATDVTWTS